MDLADKFFETLRQSKLIRTDRRWLGGVCGAISMYTGIDIALIRGVCVFLTLFFSLWSLVPLAYALTWLLLPNKHGQILIQEIFSGNIRGQHLGALGIFLLSLLGIVMGGYGTWVLGWFGLLAALTNLIIVCGIVAVLVVAGKNPPHYFASPTPKETANYGGYGGHSGNGGQATHGGYTNHATHNGQTTHSSHGNYCSYGGNGGYASHGAHSNHGGYGSYTNQTATHATASSPATATSAAPMPTAPMPASPNFAPDSASPSTRGATPNFVAPQNPAPGMMPTPYIVPPIHQPIRNVLSPVVGLITMGILAIGLAAICFIRISLGYSLISPELFLCYTAFSSIVLGSELTYAALHGKQGGWLTTMTILLAIFSFPIILICALWVIDNATYL